MGPGVGGGDGKTALLTFFIGQLTDGCLGSGPGVVITVLVQQTAEHPRGVGYVCARVGLTLQLPEERESELSLA